MLMLTCFSSVTQDENQSWTSGRVSSPQPMGRFQGEVMVLTVAQVHSGVFLCDAENAIGSQRSRPASQRDHR